MLPWFVAVVGLGLAGWFYWQSRHANSEADKMTKRVEELDAELKTEKANHANDVGRLERTIAERTQELFTRDVELRALHGVRSQTIIGETSPGGATVTLSESPAATSSGNVDV